MPHFAVIGGGFCGTLTLVNLIRHAQSSFSVTLVEKTDRLGAGIAYNTTDPCYLLNVPAVKMEALYDKPGHFFQWLTSRHELLFDYGIAELLPESFIPRAIYKIYLHEILQESLSLAKEKGIDVTFLKDEVVNLEPLQHAIKLYMDTGSFISADAAVLALGISQNKSFPAVNNRNYIDNIWSRSPENILQWDSLDALGKKCRIAIIGCGLTMVDVCMSLKSRRFPGQIYSFSRLGNLPKVHNRKLSSYHRFIDVDHPPENLLELLKTVRREIALSEDWRNVIDQLRMTIGSIWERLSWNDRKRAMKHLLNKWNLFRHRMPWKCWEELEPWIIEKRLTLVRSKVISVSQQPFGIVYQPHGSEDRRIFEADFVINCTGPELNISKHTSKLVQNILRKGIALPDPLMAGIQADKEGLVKGQSRLFAVGQILFGERLETTAVPDLRKQCWDLAIHLLQKFHDTP